MPAHNTAQKEKKSGPKGKAGGKGLSKKDRQATENNWDNVEEYLGLLKQGLIVDGLTTARVIKMVGASRCQVQHMNGTLEIYPFAGGIKLTSGHKYHVQACISPGSVVLINGLQITGTLTSAQMVRAERYLTNIQALGLVDPKRSPAGSLRIPAEFLARILTEARIVFPPTFFGAPEQEEAGNYVFDHTDQPPAPKAEVKAKAASKAATKELDDRDLGEDGIDLDDL
jgi:hypothetical protein